VDPFLGLALSTSLSAWANFLFLGRALSRRAGSLRGLGVGRALLQMTLLSAVMGVGCAFLHLGLERFLPGGGFAGELLRLLVAVGAGIGITVAGVGMLAIPEGKFLADRLRAYLPAWSRFRKRG
jgi:peptidoglycan biosynthesis protein MviN/MurJ (putative lipid II flippase)